MATQDSLGVDVLALALLDELLEAGEDGRAARLARLAVELPAVHARLVRLVDASEASDDSLLPGAALAGVRRQAAIGEPRALQPGDTLAGYRLVRVLGRGGMSVVWLAERADGVVKRQVAIKLPLAAPAFSGLGERFARERDVLASLTHPHIARLYDAGVAADGQPFIALELIDGVSIAAYCVERRLPIEDRLRLFLQVLSAVDHAHKHLVVHRDLKPSNILVDASGHAKLLDFGVAKLLGEGAGDLTQLTQFGACAFTLRYAAPEQIAQGVVTTATDVYSLGVLLYELLTGLSPYASSGLSTGALVHAVLNVESPAPSRAALEGGEPSPRSFADAKRLRAALLGDLDTVVLKALHKTPGGRYGSVERFGDDIRRYLARQPISARRPSWAHRLALFTRRHRAASAAGALGAIATLLLAGVAAEQHRESLQQAARATAVSGFLSDMVSDAEADETRTSGEVTGREIVDAAALRARLQFGDRPRLEGELLGELGRMYARLGEPAKSVEMLAQALALLESNAPSSDPALNKARAELASVLVRSKESVRAEALARRALADCTGPDKECAKARAYAQVLLRTLEGARGHCDQALTHAGQAVAEMERGFGAADENTIDALENLAVIERNCGRLQEAVDVLDRVLALGEHKTLRLADRLFMLRTKAMLQLDLGHYAAAQTQLTGLVDRTTDPLERATQFRLLSNALAAAGEATQARLAAEKAIALSGAGPMQPNTVFSLQARARSLALLGFYADALQDLQRVIDRLAALGYGPDSVEVLRARRLRGETLLRAGDVGSARGELEAVAQALAQRQSGHVGVDLGQTLDLLGCVARETGDAPRAAILHAQARAQFEKDLPANHPFLDRNALYQVVAVELERDTSGNRERVLEQAAHYKRWFAADSPWVHLIERHLDTTHCIGKATEECSLIL